MSISFGDALKAKKIRDFFHKYGRIYIVVDATVSDVLVPEFLRGDPSLRLVLNTRMPQPIYIRDTFIESNFSFSGVAHHCVIPLQNIWAAYVPDQDLESGLVWEESMPETVKLVLDAASELKEGGALAPEKPKVASSESNPKKTSRRVGHLRVVK